MPVCSIYAKNCASIINKGLLGAALFPAPRGRNPIRPGNYQTEGGLNFTGIDFPTRSAVYFTREVKSKSCNRCVWLGKGPCYWAQNKRTRRHYSANKGIGLSISCSATFEQLLVLRATLRISCNFFLF